MNGDFRQIGAILGALLALGGCATAGEAGQGFDGRAKQAEERLPEAVRFYDEGERKLVEDAQEHQRAARKAVEEGDPEKARAEAGAAAERYARFVDSFPASEWRITFRYKAAEFFLFAQRQERAAEEADRVMAEPAATDVTRAMAAQLSAVAWRGIANQRTKEGKLDPIRLVTVAKRASAPLAPHPPPEPWRRFVDAVDAFLRVWEKHPEVSKRPAERNLALTPWQAALSAAEIQYSCDAMEDARHRLDRIVETWPGEADVMKNAVPLLLQSLLALEDRAAFSATKDRLEKVVAAQEEKAQDAQAKEIFAKIREEMAQLEQEIDFSAAKRLLDEGKLPEAAQSFERFAAAHASSPDAATALHNAALAWDKAQKPERSAAARELLVTKHPDSRMAPLASLYLAGGASKRGDHEAAARHYLAYLERWPEAANRCVALQNVGYELDVIDRKLEAAERYLAFGTEGHCRQERPNEAAKALYRGGKLFIELKERSRAKEAFESAATVEGVNDPVAKGFVEEAKRQSKRL